jgi:acetoacetyl-CoA synthetase
MAAEGAHRIRLQGPWRLVRPDGGETVVHCPYRDDDPNGWSTYRRRFQWSARLEANEKLVVEIPSETLQAFFNGTPMKIVEANGRRFAEIGRTVESTNELELRLFPERDYPVRPFVFEGATLVVANADEPIWRPSVERVRSANITRFQDDMRERGHAVGDDYASFHDWSIENHQAFWGRLWEQRDSGYLLKRTTGRSEVVLGDETGMFGAKWFPNATVNYAFDTPLRTISVWQDPDPNQFNFPAVVSWNESGRQRTWTYPALFEHMARLARALRAMGVVKGDRVAAYMPNLPENVPMFLAAASMGAVWSSCSPDFGEAGALDRLGQIGPKVLLVADGYWFKGKRIDTLDRAWSLAEKLPTVERVVLVPYTNPNAKPNGIRNAVTYEEFIGPKSEPPPKLEFAQLPFDHPLYILFSSGTTGVPKGIVHGHGGSLLQHVKELQLHTDVKYGDRLFYFTTCGWMMWNWLVSGLACNATIYLYDGSPFHAKPDILWDMAEKEQITHFGASAKYFAAAEKASVKPIKDRDLSSLRTILSTGSPLAPESFDYIYRDVKNDVCLSSISGGTDIVSCFALGNPTLPVYRGELQCIGLGMAVEVWGEDGKPVESGPGELVCTKPFPSMPVSFWNDPDGTKYKAAYFEHFPDVWRHGDFVEKTEHGGLIVYGRSDATLNPSGVRIGTAEIYRQVERLPEILESLAVGQPWDGDERIILFVRLKDGVEWTAELEKGLREEIRTGATPRHVPARIIPAPDLPRTLNAKLAELAVRDVLAGRTVRNVGALANPESLEFFKNLPELQS